MLFHRSSWIRVAVVTALASTIVGHCARGAAAPFGWFGEKQPAGPPANPAFAPAANQQSSWTQRMTAPLTPSYWTSEKSTNASTQAAAQRHLQNDPTSLSFPSGPPTPQLYVSMAELAARSGNVEQARQLFRRSLEMNRKDQNALLGLARLEDREGRMNEAVAVYQQAAQFHPNSPTVLNDFGLCLVRQNRIAEAYPLLRRAVNLDPKKDLYRNNMAKVLIEMNRLDEALANLNSVHPPAVAQYNMGVLLQQRDRNAESVRYLNNALAIEPRMEAARMLLARANSAAASRQVVARAATPASTGSRPAVELIPQQPWTPPAQYTAASDSASAAGIDDSILPTPEESSDVPSSSGYSYPTTSTPEGPPMPPLAENSGVDQSGPALLPAAE